MREQHDQEIREFNDRWEYTLFKLSETSKKIEDDLHKQHQQEMEMLEDDIQKMSLENIKYSGGLLDKFHKLRHLVKAKRYSKARQLQQEIHCQEDSEIRQAEVKLNRKIEKLRSNKRKKHSNEYNSIKARLEKSINSKLKQRMVEYERLLLRIQNCHNDMTNRQSVEFGKIQSVHAKLLSKYSLNLDDMPDRHQQLEFVDQHVIHEEVEDEVPSAEPTPRDPVLQESNFNVPRSDSQGQMQVVYEKQEESHPSDKEVRLDAPHNEATEFDKENLQINSQGQINGYWNKKIITELKPNTLSDMKDSIKLDLSKEPEQVLSNFHRISTEQLKDEKSITSRSSRRSLTSSSSDSGSSDSSSSEESDSDFD